MSDEQWIMPPNRDLGFYQRRKHDKWREVPPPSPQLETPVADTHAHVHLLPDPLWELERAAANGVQLISCVADPTDDVIEHVFSLREASGFDSGSNKDVNENTLVDANTPANSNMIALPRIVFTLGVHPHDAKDYTPEVEEHLVQALSHPDSRVVGEIGLDYYYDLSPRSTQRDVLRQQIRLAHELDMPVALHVRSGKDPVNDDAHREVFEILRQEGFPKHGTLLHCCSLPAEQLKPWIEADCYIAYGGAFTFKNSTAAREAVHSVPTDRLLLETDAPYMTPEPMRGTTCTPAHVVFTAAALAQELGAQPGAERKALLEKIWENSNRFFTPNDTVENSVRAAETSQQTAKKEARNAL